ncbi:nitrous oxide reductase accessory protein NosL [Halobellus litoreus]|uniref:Nitrous oxide reductase accessory protein NosL n=1 Tax=Halobellus litoreus TaxID=755310 RepID=A0ABD6DZD6_9EURY|nr:nitrous oxide reductase accessory protein NosL [Halobellus litoreus]
MDSERPGNADESTEARPIGRRPVLLAGTGMLVGSLSGCLGGNGGGGDGSDDAPAAITIPEDATCDVCGMTIRQHPGPSAEIFYADQEPEGHENPARFDSTWEAYQYEFERDEEGWEDVAFYVTDYSAVDYETFEDGGDTLITRHYEASSFAPVTDVTFVVDSDVKGTMGRDLIGFGDEADAESFQSEFGGSLTGHDGVTPEVVAGLGM